ncbi:heavy metal-associated domain-containing protein [Myroides ceti]|uniref:Heavy metal-associated domain-containing protein n=1 Tax=Paenimyroides ceti TaxID=395087 RepID=A0ABT8CZP6_9FLAO|nr:heavy metal-associated domain-containing protein [Paenimyroides ceti]MDN3709787.1 heavy metal-associated domain-containing protein [Paenimyroides ceti]
MKIKKTAVLLFAAGLIFAGCKQSSNKQEENGIPNDTVTLPNETASTEKVSGSMEKATFQIEGMSCAVGCASVIQGKLAKLDGVKSATVDFESKTATVEFDNAKQTTTTIQTTVEKNCQWCV